MANNTFNDSFSDSDLQRLVVFYWEQVLTSVLVILLGITGIIGNTMIILAVVFSRKLQTSTNAFIASLAVTDLFTSIFLIFHGIASLGKHDWPIPDAEWLCSVTAFVIYAGTGTSLWHLGIIALNRLILIMKPFLYPRIFTQWTVIFLIMTSWFIPSGTILILLLNGIGRLGYDHIDLTCSALEESNKVELFTLIMTLINFPIPLFAILISYTCIYVYLRRHFRNKRNNFVTRSSVKIQTPMASASTSNTDPTLVTSTSSAQLTSNLNEIEMKPSSHVDKSRIVDVKGKISRTVDAKGKISHEEIEITKNLFLVVCSFFVCFTPFFILIFISVIPNVPYILFYNRVLILANSTINFVIYATRHPVFRVIFSHMMRCSYAKIPQPSKLLKFLARNSD